MLGDVLPHVAKENTITTVNSNAIIFFIFIILIFIYLNLRGAEKKIINVLEIKGANSLSSF